MSVLRRLIPATLLLVVTGCTSQAWYEGFREQQRQACYDLPTAQRAECLEKTMSYRDYQRARQERTEPR